MREAALLLLVAGFSFAGIIPSRKKAKEPEPSLLINTYGVPLSDRKSEATLRQERFGPLRRDSPIWVATCAPVRWMTWLPWWSRNQ